MLLSDSWRVSVKFVAMLAALALAGAIRACIGGSGPQRAVLQVVGAADLALTYGIGR